MHWLPYQKCAEGSLTTWISLPTQLSPTNKKPHSLQTHSRTHQLYPYPNLPHGKLACYIDTLRSLTRPNSPVTSFHVKNVKRLSSANKQPDSLQTLSRTHQLHPYPNLPHGKLACYIDTMRSITRPNSPVTSFHVKNVKRLNSTNENPTSTFKIGGVFAKKMFRKYLETFVIISL